MIVLQARRADAFDVMLQQSGRRSRDGSAPPFTAGQISAGRDYAALFERCAASGFDMEAAARLLNCLSVRP